MGIVCLHTVTQMDLWLLREVKVEEQKQGAGIAAASPELQGLAPWPVPAGGGSRARPQPLPPGRPLLHRGGDAQPSQSLWDRKWEPLPRAGEGNPPKGLALQVGAGEE